MGPYTPSSKGNQYLIVTSDICSKWVEAKAVRKVTTSAIITFLHDEIFCRFGFPQFIISDNGSQFCSKVWTAFCRQNRIIHHTTAIYSARQNQVERRNQCLKDKLRILLLDSPHKNWDKHLPQILFSLRSSINQATQQTPAQIYFNQNLKHPQDPTPPSIHGSETYTHHRLAVSNQAKYQKKYTQKNKPIKLYPPGTLVLIRNHILSNAEKGISKAFCPKWIGPYEIVHTYTSGIYICRDVDQNSCIKKVSHEDTQLRYLPTFDNISRTHSTSSSPSSLINSVETEQLELISTSHHSSKSSLDSTSNAHKTLPPSTLLLNNETSSVSSPILSPSVCPDLSCNSDKPRKSYRTRIFNSKYFGKEWVI